MKTYDNPVPQLSPFPGNAGTAREAAMYYTDANNTNLSLLTKSGGRRRKRRRKQTKRKRRMYRGGSAMLRVNMPPILFPDPSGTTRQSLVNQMKSLSSTMVKSGVNSEYDTAVGKLKGGRSRRK